MSTEQKKDWFVELGLVERKAEILEWGGKMYPYYSNNENMMAQMWWTQHEGKVIPEQKAIVTILELRKRVKEFVDAGDLLDEKGKPRKAWGNIEVLVVGPLGDSKAYFGCEKCTRGIDKNISICLNDDANWGHPDERVEGKMIAWQNWAVGDGTDEAIVSFAPNNKQSPKQIQGRVLTLEGSMNVRDGRYSVWAIAANKAVINPGGSGATIDMRVLKQPEPEVVPYDPIIDEDEEVIIDDETNDEIVSSETKEFIDDDEFFADVVAEETSRADIKSIILDYDGFVKAFRNSLDRHVMTKKVPVENMVRWLAVRPQVRELTNVNDVVQQFLQVMVEEKVINIDKNDFLTRV